MTANTKQHRKKRSVKESAFVRTVRTHYQKHGRHDLPWRRTTDPYRILVSEIMLQQTQVLRVVAKYKEFIQRFPTARALARASLGDVLRIWQGLGYNRRARMLWECAKQIDQRGSFPKTYDDLVTFTGVGPYTAGAIMAFAFNQPIAMIETNIRTVYLHHFFPRKRNVLDAELLPYIMRTLDERNPREWYAALMDYGAYLKREEGNQNQRSRHYTKQSRFKGSTRQIRGAILRILSEGDVTERRIRRALPDVEQERLYTILRTLVTEGMVVRKGRRFQLPT